MASEGEDGTLTSFSPRDEDGLVKLVSKYPRAGDEWKKVNNCKYVYVEIDDVSFTKNSLQETLDLQSDVIAIIVPLIKDRFSSLVENEVFQAMKWIDLQQWEDDQTPNIGRNSDEEFQKQLDSGGFNKVQSLCWIKKFSNFGENTISGFKFIKVWSQLFMNCQKKFPNIFAFGQFDS